MIQKMLIKLNLILTNKKSGLLPFLKYNLLRIT